jgi:FkbM family methyltransferase
MAKISSLRQAVRRAALKLTGAGPDTPSLKQHLRSLLPAGMRGSGGVSADDIARLHAASQAEKIRQLFALYEGLSARVAAAEAERDQLRQQYAILRAEREELRQQSNLLLAEQDQLRQQYAILRAERDQLLNERDPLLVALQQAQRGGGLTPHGMVRHAFRPDFPVDALPRGALPAIIVVDIGAQSLANEEHAYQPLLSAVAAQVIGFEPLLDKAEIRKASEPYLTMLNHFVGDGTRRLFHVNRDDTTSSLLPANTAFLDRFESLSDMCSPVSTHEVDTIRLDDVAEITDCDFLKVDVQGGELDVLKGASMTLAKAVAVHIEIEFSEVYKDQPLFGDIDTHLRAAGFELIDIVNAGYATTRGLMRPSSRSRLLWGEAIYMRRPDLLSGLGADKILRAAVIAHVNYGMHDIAASFLSILDTEHGRATATAYSRALALPA